MKIHIFLDLYITVLSKLRDPFTRECLRAIQNVSEISLFVFIWQICLWEIWLMFCFTQYPINYPKICRYERSSSAIITFFFYISAIKSCWPKYTMVLFKTVRNITEHLFYDYTIFLFYYYYYLLFFFFFFCNNKVPTMQKKLYDCLMVDIMLDAC